MSQLSSHVDLLKCCKRLTCAEIYVTSPYVLQTSKKGEKKTTTEISRAVRTVPFHVGPHG